MAFYALGIVLSSFLLFQIEPILGKWILPWFGGGMAVWTTTVLFFQVLLTGGYAYAHWLSQGRRRTAFHLVLLAVSMGLMFFLWRSGGSPVLPGTGWKPSGVDAPARGIFLALSVSVGLPFLLLSANNPWMQSRFRHLSSGVSPYRLYAFSNAASLLALISYPTVIEPTLSLSDQGWLWAGGYIVFCFLAGREAIRSLRAKTGNPEPMDAQPSERPSAGRQALWVGLSAAASLLMLATTNHITREVAAVPFLWVLPLAIYLASFILTFSGGIWYSRQTYLFLLFAATVGFGIALSQGEALSLPVQLTMHSLILLVFCMVCHGELYGLRPKEGYLTRFYLWISLGGALGGAAVNFLAPVLFQGYFELPIGIIAVWVLLFLSLIVRRMKVTSTAVARINNILLFVGMQLAFIVGVLYILFYSVGSLGVWRNFYGVLQIKEQADPSGSSAPAARVLFNGMTVHGYQFPDSDRKDTPTAYYGRTSGIGLVLRARAAAEDDLRVGVLGLGVGTLASYGRSGDIYRFYEINPDVIRLAEGGEGFFSYLKDSAANIEIVAGDARLSLEHELSGGEFSRFDVLVLDVFSSDSVPIHLLTAEAVQVFLEALRPDGILAVHVSSVHLDLVPVLWTLADHFQLARIVVADPGDGVVSIASTWVLLAREPSLLADPILSERAEPMADFSSPVPLWTDQYSDPFQIIR
jgi:hypothetical protein